MTKKAFIIVLLILISLTSVSCRQEAPQEVTRVDGFRVILYEPEVEFPDSISFDIEVEGEAEISEIALHYQIDKLSPIPVTSIAFPSFETALEVKANWKWDMRKTGGLPPGARLRYWWSIEDVEGNGAETDVTNLSFDDRRHSWKSLASNRIDLSWYEGSNSFGQELLAAAEESLDRLATDIGAQPGENARIYVYSSAQDLREALIYPQEWTGGVAYAEYGTMAIGISTRDLDWGKRTIAHELAHLVIHQAIFSGYGMQLPTWLDEGLAMYAEGELSIEMRRTLEDAIYQGKLFSVKSLSSSFPAQFEAAYLAYAQSYSLVEFLLEEHGGKPKMLELLNAFKEGSGYVEALDQVYALDIEQLDNLWRQHVGSSSGYIALSCIG
ncbi:MAG: peptidase MA domain-containing protein [Dehalococcoidia bacterium]|nr:peptidase MA domain-containing protein [Dehalococcoidia bacterium]